LCITAAMENREGLEDSDSPGMLQGIPGRVLTPGLPGKTAESQYNNYDEVYMIRRLLLTTLVCSLLLAAGCMGNDSSSYDTARCIISSGLVAEDGNTFVAYRVERSPGDHDIHLLKLDNDGHELWDKALFVGDNRRASVVGMVEDDKDGVFVASEVLTPENGKEGPHRFDRNILIRVDGQGTTKLQQDFDGQGTNMVADGTGGIVLVWTTEESQHVLRQDNAGNTLWTHAISSRGNGLKLAAGENGESFILWRDFDNPYFTIQKLSAGGETLWGEEGTLEGVRIKHLETALPPEPEIISDGTGGAFVSWAEPTHGGMPSYIWLCRIKADGNVDCDGPVRDLTSTANVYTQLVADGSGGAFVVWEDHREGMALFAQRISAEGEPSWQENGVPVCTDLPEVSPRFHAVFDGKGGVIVAWIAGAGNLYAQTLDAYGQRLWAKEGLLVASNACHWPLELCAHRAGGFVAGWSSGGDAHQPDYSFVQRINAEGHAIWGEAGIELVPQQTIAKS
jgi:hypothetical protein